MKVRAEPELSSQQEIWLRDNPAAGPLITTVAAQRIAGRLEAEVDAKALSSVTGRPAATSDIDMANFLVAKYADAITAMGDFFGALAGAALPMPVDSVAPTTVPVAGPRGRLPKIAMAQMDVKAGMPVENFKTIKRMVKKAKANGAELVVFPEMCIGGYFIGDRYQRDLDYIQDLDRFNEHIKTLSANYGIAIAWGNVCLDTTEKMRARGLPGDYHPNPDGTPERRLNALFMAQNGEWVKKRGGSNVLPEGVMAKTLFPDDRYFDDSRYFTPLLDHARDLGVDIQDVQQPFLLEIDGREVPVGGIICQDGWSEHYRRDGESLSPAKAQIANGAECVISINSSPWATGKAREREDVVRFIREQSGDSFVPFVYVAHTGVMNNNDNFMVFDGGSTAYNANGELVGRSNRSFEEDMIFVDDLRSAEPIAPLERTLPANYETIAKKHDAIVRSLRSWRHSAGQKNHPKVVIGLSGGIDSSIAAAMWVEAIGAENVIGVNMPTEVNSEATKSSARKLAAALGIPITDIPIGELAAFKRQIIQENDLDGSSLDLTDIDKECISAKIRGMMLSDFSSKHSTPDHVGLFSSNSNKLEAMTGYLAIDGDGRGGVCPNGDLWKVEVYKLGKYLNDHVFGREVIPTELLPDDAAEFGEEKIPSGAELSKGQINPLKLGYHDALGMLLVDERRSEAEILRWYLEGTLHEHMATALKASGAPELAEHAEGLIRRYGMDEPQAFLNDFGRLVRRSSGATFKRGQMPPIVSVGSATYGHDLREAQMPYARTREASKLARWIDAKLKKYGESARS